MPNASSIPIILATISRVPKKTPYLSKARKEWRVVRADNTKTIIEDVEKGKTFEMNTRDLYEAHLHLEENDIRISSVTPYVGKENAPAASALLYNIVGRGQSFNNLRKFTQEIFKYLKLK
jgi:small ligand-binding sensory domain FIST